MQKLLTRPWIGILLVVLSSIIAEYFFLKYGFQKGFTSGAISYQIFLAIAIACIIASPLILEKSFITTMTGIFILSLFFIATILVAIFNMSGDWGGSITFVFVIFVFLYFVLWELLGYKQEQSTIENQITSEDRRRIPSEVRKEVWNRDGGKCKKCGSRHHIEFDHIVPVSKGGSNTANNIELLCRKCNRSKHAKIE
jgi:Ca2+/Na+ antiporter